MTSQTSRGTVWRRAVAGGALAAGLIVGLGAPAASAQPGDPVTPTPAPQPMTADQALAIIQSDYDTGSGGGQLSNLIHQVLKLRSQGYMPSQGNRDDIEAALNQRPNEMPLIDALKSTLAFQRRTQSQRAAAAQSPVNAGINQSNPGSNPGQLVNPGGGINIPLGP